MSVRLTADVAAFKAAMGDAEATTRRTAAGMTQAGKTAKGAGKDVESLGVSAKKSGTEISNSMLAARVAAAAGGGALTKYAVQAKLDLRDVAKSARDNQQAWTKTGIGLAAAGGAIAVGVGLAVYTFAKFDKAMSGVQAATRATGSDMTSLRDAAVKAGEDTAYSAQEAADAITELSKAGVSVKDVLSGGLSGALALAAAGQLEVGKAAEITATALGQFGLSGDKAGKVADLLAAGANEAMGSVEDLGMGLKQGGLVAAQFGLSVDDTVGALAQFAQQGLIGSDAGTSLKTMLLALANPTGKTKTLMDELGISAYDATGKFVGLEGLAQILQDRLGGLTQEQRNAALAQIFGNDAIRAANVLYKDGAAGVAAWRDKVSQAGYAAAQAAIQQDNLVGDIEKLGGSLESVFIKSGSGANDFLRNLTQQLEGVVNVVGSIPAPLLSAGTAIAGLVGAAALLGGGFLFLTPKVVGAVGAFRTLRVENERLAGSLGRVGRVLGAGGVALAIGQIGSAISQAFAGDKTKSVADMTQRMLDLSRQGKSVNDAFSQDVFTGYRSGVMSLGKEYNNFGDALERVNAKGLDDMASQVLGVDSAWSQLSKTIRNMDESLTGLVSNGAADTAAESFRKLAESSKGQITNLEGAQKAFPGYISSLQDTANQLGVTLNAEELYQYALGNVPPKLQAVMDAKTNNKAATEAATQATQAETTALAELGVSLDGSIADLGLFTVELFKAGGANLSARDATSAFEAAIDAATVAAQQAATQQGGLQGALQASKRDFDLNTESGRTLNGAYQSVISTGMGMVTANAKNGASQASLQGQLQRTYDNAVRSAVGFGMARGDAERLTRSVLGVPNGVSIKSWMSSEAKRMAEATAQSLNNIDGRVVNTTIINTTRNITTYEDRGNPGGTSFRVKGSSIRGFASGGRTGFDGRVPGPRPLDMRRDNVLGLVGGEPIGLQGREWVINGRMSDRYDRYLSLMNRGMFPTNIPGLAAGGRPTERAASSISVTAPPVNVTGAAAPSVSTTVIVDGREIRHIARSEISAYEADQGKRRRG